MAPPRTPAVTLSAAEAAYRAASAALEMDISSRLEEEGVRTASPRWHSSDPVEWLRENNDGEDEEDNTESMDLESGDGNEAAAADDDEEIVENPLFHFAQQQGRDSRSNNKYNAAARGTATATPQAKRQPKSQGEIPASSLNRSQTPVMSNTRPGGMNGGANNDELPRGDRDRDDDDGVASEAAAAPSRGRRDPFAFASSTTSYKPSSNAAYRRYHDALLAFCRHHHELNPHKNTNKTVAASTKKPAAKEDLDTTMSVDSQDDYVADDDGTVDDTPARMKADVHFATELHRLCWETSQATAPPSGLSSMAPESFTRTQKEGNCWLLLARLRRLGPDAICWEETTALRREMEAFYHALSGLSVDESPRAVLGRLNHGDGDGGGNRIEGALVVPFALRRQKAILTWLETIFGYIVPDRSAWPLPSSVTVLYPPQALPVTSKDRELFSVALSLMLAGRWDDARQLARDLGTPWRAAAWNGDDPYGYDDKLKKTVGNEQRPLWRRMMWLQSEKLNGKPGSASTLSEPKLPPRQGGCPEEGALAALMSCHLDNALSNAALRTWEKGLYASLRCVWGRIEDVILYHHNQARTVFGASLFLTTGFTKFEEDHLNSTARYGELNEAAILNELQASEFVQMHSRGVCTEATGSILAGQESLYKYLEDCIGSVEGFVANDKEAVRFLVHLVVYLAALCPVTSTVPREFQDALDNWKEFLIVAYLEVLSQRDGLSSLYVLYASLLPSHVVLAYLPTLLTNVHIRRDREEIVRQLHEYMPTIDLEVLTTVVTLEIQAEELPILPPTEGKPLPPLSDAPNQVDLRKMKSVDWLCINPEHKDTALVFANMLLRSFFIPEKLGCANMFIQEYLPPGIATPLPVDDGGDASMELTGENQLTMEEARSEHAAYKSYLRAMEALKAFSDELRDQDPQPVLLDDEFDPTKLDPPEAEIAIMAGRRQLIEDKRTNSRSVVEAATAATASLMAVLTHPGGWLVTESNEEETLVELRRKYLPQVVLLYLWVCEGTADWMSSSLDDALQRLECRSLASALRELDLDADVRESPLNPAYWHSQALQVSLVVASDEHDVKSSMTDPQIEDLLRKLAETKVQQLKCEADVR